MTPSKAQIFEQIIRIGMIFILLNKFEEKINSNLLEEQNEKLASEGYRVIALANGKVEKKNNYKESDIKDLVFMGMVGFIDPIRKEAVHSISECKNAGIKVIVVKHKKNSKTKGIHYVNEKTSDVHVHMLRHTFATRCIEAGMKPKTLQTILGHSNIGITMNLYVHITEDEKQKEIDMHFDMQTSFLGLIHIP